ncbi:MAG: FHIPEP family type III secretion protein [Kofleriaceae bacterium]|nr:FHIPEP family type III secretion protein [Kofleriaceae bacterium]
MTASSRAEVGRRWSWGEVAMASVIVAVVLLIVSPVPALVLDVLFAASIGLAVVMLMASLYVRTPSRLATFPALILVATLVRLGLLVAATRMILTEARAGDVVAAFGRHVAGGSVVVGLVVFAVVAIFQFVVIARGTERVAEVAARFALDAMPGKQMAIDADLRAAVIDGAEAARRRDALEREAQLYGAMDGAMKFVKGDAIAALLVVLVVLGAGLAVGAGQHGLSLSQAVATYAVLAVGAGLVVQLPALLVALAAGLLVTRVAAERGDGALGDDVAAQLIAQPRALIAAAVALAALGLVPGVPTLPFLLLAAVLGPAALVVTLRARVATIASPEVLVAASPVRTDATPPVAVELGAELAAAFAGEPARAALAERLDEVRQVIFDDLGVAVPAVAVRTGGALGARELALALDGVAVDYADVPAGEIPAGIAEATARSLRRCAHELITLDAVQARLDAIAMVQPAAVREVVPRVVALPLLVEVVRRLVREQVPVRDLGAVLGAIAAAPAPAAGFTGRDVETLVETARAALRRQITAAHAPRGQLAAWTLDAMIEDALRGAVVTRDGAAVLALEPELARDIVAATRAVLPGRAGVVLTSGDVRRHLRALLAPELPDVAVLSPHDLAPGVTVRSAGRIQV